jgi:recombination DNA repair RAD52 pathway protein
MKLTPAQYAFLVRPLADERVSKDPRGNSYLEQWDIRRHLIRAFGFGGWDFILMTVDLVAEREGVTSGGKPCWTVVYRVTARLTIKSTDEHPSPSDDGCSSWEDGAVGDAVNQPSLGEAHDQALKSAISGALKRCAVNLGDQFGLGLYSGQSGPVVVGSLIHPVEPKEKPVEPKEKGDSK